MTRHGLKPPGPLWVQLKGRWPVIQSVAVLMAILLLLGHVWSGGLEIGIPVYAWFDDVPVLTVGVGTAVLLPLASIRKTRPFAACGIWIAACVFGATLVVRSLVLTYESFGVVAAVVGFSFLGIGVVPLAMVATLREGLLPMTADLVMLTALTCGTWLAGRYLQTAGQLAQDLDKSPIIIYHLNC